MTIVVVETSGGVISNICSDSDVHVLVVDHDELDELNSPSGISKADTLSKLSEEAREILTDLLLRGKYD